MRKTFAAAALVACGILLGLPASSDIASYLCLPSVGCLRGDGTNLFLDEDQDGVVDTGEPNLTVNAPTNAAGDETIQGNLTVVGAITETGVTQMHERLLGRATSSGDIPTITEQLQAWNLLSTWDAVADSGIFVQPYKVRVTRFCAAARLGATLTGSCIVHLRNTTTAANIGSITIANTGGNMTGVQGQSFCAAVGADVNAAAELRIQTDGTTCAPGAWNWTDFEFLGYGID